MTTNNTPRARLDLVAISAAFDANRYGHLSTAIREDVADAAIGDFLTDRFEQQQINRAILRGATRRMVKELMGSTFAYGAFLDWRGRVFVNGVGLAPQGKDAGRGSLAAANPVALGRDGLRFLKIGVATTWGAGGIDKATLADRVAAVDAMIADGSLRNIVDEAHAGTGFAFLDAEEPVQFLALATDLLAALDSGSPETFKSGVFVGLDATCSGLQILAMLTRDRDTARRVNVEPVTVGNVQKRGDVYLDGRDGLVAVVQQIAATRDPAAAVALIEEAAAYARASKADQKAMTKPVVGDDWAVFWAQRGLTRSDLKKPVMVYNYGGGKRTFAASFREDTGAPWGACMWLAKVLADDVLPALLPRANAWMKWAQEVARLHAKAGKPVAYTLPDGFPFSQAVYETKGKNVEVTVPSGARIQLGWQTKTDKLSAQKMASGIAPNIVHSLDGFFVRQVVRALKAAGISTFYTVHDCFYLLPGDWSKGWAIIRKTFVETFHGGLMEEIRQDMMRTSGLDLPALPSVGDLDLSAPLTSEFLFS